MFLRKRRQTFDDVADAIVSAASVVGAPTVQESSGLLLKVISVSGDQLSRLADKLLQFIREAPALGHSATVKELLEELGKCSHLYIVSTSIEVLVASDKSLAQYQYIDQMASNLMPKFVEFRDECTRFIRGLDNLSA